MKAQALRDNSTNSYMMSKKTVEVNPTHTTHDRVDGGSADKSIRHEGFEFTERAEIVEVAHTIPQERIPKRILD